jgi:hypothetical protein
MNEPRETDQDFLLENCFFTDFYVLISMLIVLSLGILGNDFFRFEIFLGNVLFQKCFLGVVVSFSLRIFISLSFLAVCWKLLYQLILIFLTSQAREFIVSCAVIYSGSAFSSSFSPSSNSKKSFPTRVFSRFIWVTILFFLLCSVFFSFLSSFHLINSSYVFFSSWFRRILVVCFLVFWWNLLIGFLGYFILVC